MNLNPEQIMNRLLVCQDLLAQAQEDPDDQWQLSTIGDLLDGCIDSLDALQGSRMDTVMGRAIGRETGRVAKVRRSPEEMERREVVLSEWQRAKAEWLGACLSFPCGCGARKGEMCRTGSGREASAPHTARQRWAAEQHNVLSPRQAAEAGLIPSF